MTRLAIKLHMRLVRGEYSNQCTSNAPHYMYQWSTLPPMLGRKYLTKTSSLPTCCGQKCNYEETKYNEPVVWHVTET